MLLTEFIHDPEQRKVTVAIHRGDRNLYEEADGDYRVLHAYNDRYLQMVQLQHPRWQRVVGYHLRYRNRIKPEFVTLDGAWWFSAFYRRPGAAFDQGRKWRTVYADSHVLLIQHGRSWSDYTLIGRSQPAHERKSDIRFATIPQPHPIERGTLP